MQQDVVAYVFCSSEIAPDLAVARVAVARHGAGCRNEQAGPYFYNHAAGRRVSFYLDW